MGDYAEALGAAAVQVLAEKGGRGFTHRAVDRRADVPEGTASRYARTRSALLMLAADTLFTADSQQATQALVKDDHVPETAPALTEALARATKVLLRAPERYRARVELQLEAVRTKALRQHFEQSRGAFVAALAVVLGDLGLADARHRSDVLVTIVDGVLHRQLLGEPPLADAQLRTLLGAVVSYPPAG